jgi:aspartate/methionine/tyrosine aminotransferase
MNRLSKHSAYMEWAKLCSAARFNLATSGLTNTSTAEFPLFRSDMEITGPGGYGFEPLQEQLAHHTGAPAESVVAATGASMANFLAMSVALNPGDEVIIESPAYGLFADIANYLGARITEVQRPFETGFAVDPGILAGAITPQTRLIVLSNLHNPSGALLPEEVLLRIGELAQKAGVYVLVDEVYLEMVFADATPFAFGLGQQQFPDANPFIVTNSLTKAYGLSGLRCGWILAAAPLAHRMWRLNDLFGVNAAHVAEQMAVVAFDRLEMVRTKARELLATNRQLLNNFLDAHPELPCYRPSFGTVIFPKLPVGSPDDFFKMLRDKYETSVVPGAFFGMPDHFRVGAGGTTEVVRNGLERLGLALRDFCGR